MMPKEVQDRINYHAVALEKYNEEVKLRKKMRGRTAK
jgi:hypothetical protein